MPKGNKRKSKWIDNHLYRRYNGYSTKPKAKKIAQKLRDGIHRDGAYIYYQRVRVIYEDHLKIRPFVVYVNGKIGRKK